MNERADVLDSLLKHPGWGLFAEHAIQEWAPAACWRKAKAAGGDKAAIALIDKVNEQVGLLVNWPKDELARLKRQEPEPEVVPIGGRGGYSR